MFRWTDDMIRYMADAGRQTDFHRRLTAELLPYLSPQDRVCDAGCGLGFLSLALAPHVRHVTAADCGAVTTGQEGDHTTLRTPLRLRLLYLDESGAPVTAERTDEAAAPVPGDVTTARAACLSPSLRPSGPGLELTVPGELAVERSRRCTWDAITAAELTEPEPGRRPSLVLCRPKKGESLWELAKRYRTDEQAICAANGLEQETPLPSGLLLIPRVR